MDLPVRIPVLLVRTVIKDLDLELLDLDSESCSFSGLGLGLGLEASGIRLDLDLAVAGLDTSLVDGLIKKNFKSGSADDVNAVLIRSLSPVF